MQKETHISFTMGKFNFSLNAPDCLQNKFLSVESDSVDLNDKFHK